MKSAIDEEIRRRLEKNQTRRQISDALHVGPNRISRVRKQMQAEASSATPPEPQDIILDHITEIAEDAYQFVCEAWEMRDLTNPHWVRAYSQLVTTALKAIKLRQELTPETPRQVIRLIVGDLPPEEGDGWRTEKISPDYDPDTEEPPL